MVRYSYKDLLESITKIPVHRLDSRITTYTENGDTFYVLCQSEIDDEISIEPRWDLEKIGPEPPPAPEELLLGPVEEEEKDVLEKIIDEIEFPKLEL
jgi:hypothetical protein